MLSPPLDMRAKWFAGHVAYSIAKYGMSLCVLGLAEELKADGIAVNALWPRTTIATAAIRNILGGEKLAHEPQARDPGGCRPPRLRAAGAGLHRAILIDDTFLHETGGITDFAPYRVDPTAPLAADFFVPDDSAAAAGVTVARLPFPG